MADSLFKVIFETTATGAGAEETVAAIESVTAAQKKSAAASEQTLDELIQLQGVERKANQEATEMARALLAQADAHETVATATKQTTLATKQVSVAGQAAAAGASAAAIGIGQLASAARTADPVLGKLATAATAGAAGGPWGIVAALGITAAAMALNTFIESLGKTKTAANESGDALKEKIGGAAPSFTPPTTAAETLAKALESIVTSAGNARKELDSLVW